MGQGRWHPLQWRKPLEPLEQPCLNVSQLQLLACLAVAFVIQHLSFISLPKCIVPLVVSLASILFGLLELLGRKIGSLLRLLPLVTLSFVSFTSFVSFFFFVVVFLVVIGRLGPQISTNSIAESCAHVLPRPFAPRHFVHLQ